jgi:hypothetical protein
VMGIWLFPFSGYHSITVNIPVHIFWYTNVYISIGFVWICWVIRCINI